MAKRVVDVLVPVALDRAYSYRVPEALALAPGDIVSRAARRPRGDRRGLGGEPEAQSAARQPAQGRRGKARLPPLKPELRSFVDWVANYTLSSRGMVLRMCLRMGEHLGAERERVGVRLAGAAAAAHDRGARARARAPRRRHGARQRRSGARSRRQRRRHRRPDRRRHARDRGAAAGAGRGKARSGFRADRISPATSTPPPRN